MSANIPPAKDPKQLAIEDGLKLYEQLLGEIHRLRVLVFATQIEFARRICPTPEDAINLMRSVEEETKRLSSAGVEEIATAREVLQLLSRKADPLKPDA